MRGNGGVAMIRGRGAAMMRTGDGDFGMMRGGGTAMMRTGGTTAASSCAAGAGASMIGTFGAASFLTLASRVFTGAGPFSQLASKLEPTITTV